MTEVVVRPLRADDVVAAQQTAYDSLAEAGTRYGWEMAPLDDTARRVGQLRVEHVRRHDPDGCFVADSDGRILGVALATRREQFWFLSLLTVSPEAQGLGIGRRLLEAALATFAGTGAICASDDPKALRRYGCAGFELQPCYEIAGVLDRSVLPRPAVGLRTGSFTDDRDLVESVARSQRGAPVGPDLEFFASTERSLLVLDSGAERGYAVVQDSGPAALGATSPAAARSLLWAALAESSAEKVSLRWVTAAQQWAVGVGLDARLSLGTRGSWCVAGAVGPLLPYLPNGLFG